ncbi:phosphoribosylanthranilate isomerase [Paenibacillus alvei]|uniref:phosphoribosylanthranilate isomerase n=1 Tax=Paenibacillus alvei TaxID=44250 RepID=UPI0018CE8CBA|nr:phosphoribosylanthranilate isomerase [Paenibacillus alvei]MBG9736038.1 phosphoribosylanthranilate isomerase [Paenibacillus alvei]MBG9743339.1 phosphoribosylanthranilate isomerase [Paenibacillus alvei]MCY9579392.1 phosphoribosylanthranilate isomerase [Paenibacillus alvei]MCY9586042.1 phosphoribosylanthranilate isomerase [Paenibacillus alvei]
MAVNERSSSERSSKVKICGLTNLDITRRVIQMKPDHIGFVFAQSRRQVDPQRVKQWLLELSREEQEFPDIAGVFANPTREELKQVLDLAPITSVQLHVKNNTALLAWIKDHYDIQIWKSIPINGSDEGKFYSFSTAVNELDVQYADVILLDTYCPVQGGGSGKVFDWTVIPAYTDALEEFELPLYIAGGLTPDNVGLVVREYGIQGVDVSSGVETNGVKDVVKVQEFIERVRGK